MLLISIQQKLFLGNPRGFGSGSERPEPSSPREGDAVAALRAAAGDGAGRRARGRLHGGAAHRAGPGRLRPPAQGH